MKCANFANEKEKVTHSVGTLDGMPAFLNAKNIS